MISTAIVNLTATQAQAIYDHLKRTAPDRAAVLIMLRALRLS